MHQKDKPNGLDITRLTISQIAQMVPFTIGKRKKGDLYVGTAKRNYRVWKLTKNYQRKSARNIPFLLI